MLAARRMMINAAASPPVPLSWVSTDGNNNNSATSVSSSSAFTPPANTLILVAAEWVNGNGASTTTGISDTIGGLTWTEITNGWHSNTLFGSIVVGAKCSVFWAVTGASPPSGSITITSGVSTSLHFEVVKIPGAKISGPIGTSGFGTSNGTNGASAFNLTATTSATPASDSTMIGVLGSGTTSAPPGAATDDASFTNLFSASGGGLSRSDLDASYELAGDNSVTWSIGSTTSQWWFYDGILLEVTQ